MADRILTRRHRLDGLTVAAMNFPPADGIARLSHNLTDDLLSFAAAIPVDLGEYYLDVTVALEPKVQPEGIRADGA